MHWKNKYVVPYTILQPYLKLNDLISMSQLNHMFKKLVYDETKEFEQYITTIEQYEFLDKTFKRFKIRISLEGHAFTNDEGKPFNHIDMNKIIKSDKVSSINLTFNKTIFDEQISKFTELKELTLWGDRMISGSLVVQFKNLQRLVLGYNDNIRDEHLLCLPHLISLDLTNNTTITDYGISNLPNIKVLSLYDDHGITDIGLAKLITLEELSIWGCSEDNSITSNGIKTLINLKKLYLRSNSYITDDYLENLVNLTSLNIVDQRDITNIGLSKLPQLKVLSFGWNYGRITDDGLSKLVNLTDLRINDCNEHDYQTGNHKIHITDMGIASLKALKKLTMTNIDTITNDAILNLPNLTYLDIMGITSITDPHILYGEGKRKKKALDRANKYLAKKKAKKDYIHKKQSKRLNQENKKKKVKKIYYTKINTFNYTKDEYNH
jgi:hypothetical protein